MPILMPKTTLVVPAANGQGASQTYSGGKCTAACYGTGFDGGTVTLQCSHDVGVTWFTVKDEAGGDVTFTANGHSKIISIGGTPLVRASLGGSSGATSVTLQLLYQATLIY